MRTIKYGSDEFFHYITVSNMQARQDGTAFRIAIHRFEGSLLAYLTRDQMLELRASLTDALLEDERNNTNEQIVNV